jgi:hypothetical protein
MRCTRSLITEKGGHAGEQRRAPSLSMPRPPEAQLDLVNRVVLLALCRSRCARFGTLIFRPASAPVSQMLFREPTRHGVDQRICVVGELMAFPARRTMVGHQHIPRLRAGEYATGGLSPPRRGCPRCRGSRHAPSGSPSSVDVEMREIAALYVEPQGLSALDRSATAK